MTDGATKNDAAKPRPELIPTELIDALGVVLAYGAEKYSDRNWEHGLAWGRVYGALQRHLNAWWSGEACDAETGLSHLHHAACNIAFLVAYESRQTGEDDRQAAQTGSKTQEARNYDCEANSRILDAVRDAENPGWADLDKEFGIKNFEKVG